MIRSFITWRLNFYRFGWWRRLLGIPNPRPLTPFEQQLMAGMVDSARRLYGDNVNADYAKSWMECKPGQTINIKRPARYKPPHKDRYL